MPATKRTKPPVRKLRYTLHEAAEALGIGYTQMREMAVDQGEFTTNRKPTPRSYVFIPADEIEAYAEGDLAGLREYRAKKGRTGGKK